jgi:hypothetical protein
MRATVLAQCISFCALAPVTMGATALSEPAAVGISQIDLWEQLLDWYLDHLRDLLDLPPVASSDLDAQAMSVVSAYKERGIPSTADPFEGLELIASTRTHLLLSEGEGKLKPDTRAQLEECLDSMERDLLARLP